MVRRDGNIDAAADDQCMAPVGKPLALEQNTAGLLAANQNIVRPLDLDRIGGQTASPLRSPDARRQRLRAAASRSWSIGAGSIRRSEA